MKGNIGDQGGNEGAKERGQFLEQGVLDWWAFKHPEYTKIVPQHYAMLGEWAAATLDAKSKGEGVPTVAVEVKTASRGDAWGREGTDEIPAYYRDQTDWQMAMDPEIRFV